MAQNHVVVGAIPTRATIKEINVKHPALWLIFMYWCMALNIATIWIMGPNFMTMIAISLCPIAIGCNAYAWGKKSEK
jgi:hypothetical protein